MGNKVVHYFLQWAKKFKGQKWIDHNIHAFMAIGFLLFFSSSYLLPPDFSFLQITGAPFLGAPKAIRSVVSGDRMSLEVFLTPKEGLEVSRRVASLPWLFPLFEDRILPG